MISSRLNLAKKLLKEDGIIFVSIDDNEQAYLKVLMDEIFGEENFVCNFIWQNKNAGTSHDKHYVRVLNEYVVTYAKNLQKLKTSNEDIDDAGVYKLKDHNSEERGKYKLKQLDASLTWSKNMDYEFEHQGVFYYPGGNKERFLERHEGKHSKKDWTWRWSKKKMEEGIKNGVVVFKDNKIFSKQYQYKEIEGKFEKRTSKFHNLIINEYYRKINGSNGTEEQKLIFNRRIFDYPKPVNLMKFLINIHPNKNAKVLDFFAGSGSTAHAVLELNRDDGGDRTFTLCTNNENGIAYNITYERLYTIIEGKNSSNQETSWTKKNKPYLNTKLKVYEVKYEDISLNEKNFKILDLFKEFLKSQIENTQKLSDQILLNRILNLYSQKK